MSTQAPQIEQQGNRLLVHGDMTVETVGALMAEGLPEMAGEIELDLSQVSDVDSSAVSLLFQWLREAQSRQVSLRYSNLPATLVSLATLYGVLEMLPQAAAHSH
jgi:phospholipid transport system transporter-binding protein